MIRIILNLTEQEAGAIYTVSSRIAGSPTGPRGLFNLILHTIESELVHIPWDIDDYATRGYIVLVDEWPEDRQPNTVRVEII